MKTLRIVAVCGLWSCALLATGCRTWQNEEEPQPPAPTVTAGDRGQQPASSDVVRLPRAEYQKLLWTIELLVKEAELRRLQEAQGIEREVPLVITPEEREMVLADVQRVHTQLRELRNQREALDQQIRTLEAELSALQARLGGERVHGGIFEIESRGEAEAIEPGLEEKLEKIRRKLAE